MKCGCDLYPLGYKLMAKIGEDLLALQMGDELQFQMNLS